MKNKKVLAVIILILILALVVGIIFFTRKAINSPGEEGVNFPEAENVFNRFFTDNITEDNGRFFATESGVTRITSRPTAGYTSYELENETYIRYVDRATGHLYEAKIKDAASEKITNKTLPKVEEAFFGGENTFAARTLNDLREIETFTGSLVSKNESEFEVDGEYLPTNARTIAINELGNIAYIEDREEGSELTIWDSKTKNTIRTLALPLRELNLEWVTNDTLGLTTKPSFGIPGFMFTLEKTSGSLNPLLRSVPGLTTLPSPDGSSVLFSYIGRDKKTLSVLNRRTGAVQELPFFSIGDKCAWSPNSESVYCAVVDTNADMTLPDSWYKGKAPLPGDIYRVNVSSYAVSDFVMSASAAGEMFDPIKLEISPDGENLFFINKNDLSLWMVLLSNIGNIDSVEL